MKKLNNILIYLISLISFCFVIKDINNSIYTRLMPCLSILIVLLIPKIVRKIFKVNIGYTLEFTYIVFIFFAQFLGSVMNLYDQVWWYDLFVHFLSGILSSLLSLFVLSWFKIHHKKNKTFNFIFMIIFSVAVAALWEFIEFTAFIIFKTDMQNHLTTGVFDTMQDMLIAAVGALIIAIYYLINNSIFKKIVSK